MRPRLIPEDVAKIAVGPKELPNVQFTYWETLLSEMISGDALGADRMDYLLRDSHHAGVAYGRFDHLRLTDTVRILAASEKSNEPTLGIEIGGIHSAESLLLARYFMFMQVYLHRVRMAYDLHLEEFLRDWLPAGEFDVEESGLLALTDNEVMGAISNAAGDPAAHGHVHADRIVRRNHFKPAYTLEMSDRERHDDPVDVLFDACVQRYGPDAVRQKSYHQAVPAPDFPVLNHRGRVVSSHSISEPLRRIPAVSAGFVLVDPKLVSDASNWVDEEKEDILARPQEGDDNG